MSNSGRVEKPRRFAGLDAGCGPARPLSPADADWLVEQVVQRALDPERKLRPRRLSIRTLSLAGLAIVTSAAAATIVHKRLAQHVDASAPSVSVPQRQIRYRALGVAPQRPVTEPSALTVATADIAAPVLEAKPSVTSASNAGLPAHVATAVDELSVANDLRRKAQWQAAEAAYRSIAGRFPQAPEANVAQLAAAELRLEHLGDAAGALRLYKAVPRKSALGLEALFGVSRAERALGNGTAEAAALRSLLENYPTSLQADSARERLKQLAAESVNR